MLNKDCFTTYNNELFVVCKRVSEIIGLRKGQWENESRKIQNDPLLSHYSFKLYINTKGGLQKMVCLNYKCLNMWISKINLKTLNEDQYKNIINFVNEIIMTDFKEYKNDGAYYDFESHLRDEIFNAGSFEDFLIIDREVMYEFGRIDLLAIDNNDKKVCIELKKYKEFDDTKSQLLRYRDSNEFDRVIYIAFIIDEEFKQWCKNNNIEIYTYKRKLEIEVA